MTRKQLIDAARAEGADVQWYQIANALATGRIPQPELTHAKQFNYTGEHLARVIELFGGRKLEAAR